MWKWRNHKHKKSDHELICDLSPDERSKKYMQQAREGWDRAWNIVHTPLEDGWRLENGKDLHTGCVYSRGFNNVGKVFRLEGIVSASPEAVFQQLVHGDNESPAWNPTVLECRTVQTLNENTDIAYNISMEGAGGLITSRDFVNLRHWKKKDGVMLSLGFSVLHPDMPVNKKHVRAENKPSAWVFKRHEDNPDECHFIMLLRIELKGWIPQYLVDQTLSSVMTNYLVYLRKRMEFLRENGENTCCKDTPQSSNNTSSQATI